MQVKLTAWLTVLMLALFTGSYASAEGKLNKAINVQGKAFTKFSRECKDYHRRPVLNVRNDQLNDVAFSDMMNMRGVNLGPMIILNIRRLKKLTKASQLFFVAHECGHHALGHLYFRRSGAEAEQEADCYALRTLIREGKFTLKDIKDVQEDMRKFAQASLHHRGGKERAKALLKCIEI